MVLLLLLQFHFFFESLFLSASVFVPKLVRRWLMTWAYSVVLSAEGLSFFGNNGFLLREVLPFVEFLIFTTEQSASLTFDGGND
jgi:hypothetical protein